MIETVLRVTDVNNLKIFKASGDSMADTIDDSNLLLVDMGRTDYSNGGVFLLQKKRKTNCFIFSYCICYLISHSIILINFT